MEIDKKNYIQFELLQLRLTVSKYKSIILFDVENFQFQNTKKKKKKKIRRRQIINTILITH